MKIFAGLSVLVGTGAFMANTTAAILTGSFSPLPAGSNVNLTAEGKLDWVHWGLANETSLNRKATVAPQISDFVLLYQVYTVAYQQTDNLSGFSWLDGMQVESVANTSAGVYVFGPANPRQQTNGFQFTVPADISPMTLKVYVGAYGARGRMEATLSDFATPYIDATLNNLNGGPGGVYTIQFAANSSNQKLTVRWTETEKNNNNANVSLQAATLSSTNANNLPFAKIISPTMNSNYAAPAEFILQAEAFDPDDSVARVGFYSNGTKIGESTNSPFSLSLSNVPPGHYQFTATPVDQTNATSRSQPVDIFVHSGAGMLNGSVAIPPGGVDLTAEGTLDWVHWGLTNATNVNRKFGVPARINMTTIGTNALQRYADNFTGYGWSDGTPTTNASGTQTGVFLFGMTNGFQLSVPADTAPKTLKVYVGLYGGSGKFQAWLSDFSAPAFTDRSLTNSYDNSYAVYTLDYTAASLGQKLFVRYTADVLFDLDFGNVTLQAASLSGTALVALMDPRPNAGHFTFSIETDLGRTYVVYYSDALNPADWKILTTITGSGLNQTVTDNANQPQRFYRIQSN
jgi:hypothetical protein